MPTIISTETIDAPIDATYGIDVPSDCTLIVAFNTFTNYGSTEKINTLTLDGDAFALNVAAAEALPYTNGVTVATLKNPSTGSLDLTVDWNGGGGLNEGGAMHLVYLKDEHDTTWVRDADYSQQDASDPCSVTVDSNSTDTVLAHCTAYGSAPTLDPTVIIDGYSYNSSFTDVSNIDSPGASTTTVNMTGEDYSSMGVISIIAAAAAGSTITAEAGSYALTGAAANLEQHRAVGAAPGSYGLTGAAANLERHGEVVAGAGAYALTGVDASLSTGAIVAAAAGSYALAGTDANVEHHSEVAAGAGAYALTGQAAGLALTRLLSAAVGSYSLTGAAAGLDFTAADEAELIQNHPSPVYSERPPELMPGRISIAITPVSAYSLTASAGTYTLTGVPASLGQQRVIGAASGSYALTGTASNLEQHRAVGAAAGSYALTGAAANVEHHAAVVVGAGSYALTGADASLTHAADNTLVAAAGSYALTGAAANVEHHAAVAADAGSYALTGQAAGLNLGQFLAAGVGSYALTGVPAGLRLASLVGAQPGAYTLTGADVGFVYTVPGNFTFADLAGRVLRVPREVRTLLRPREDRTLRMN